jgi:hypothetical protein
MLCDAVHIGAETSPVLKKVLKNRKDALKTAGRRCINKVVQKLKNMGKKKSKTDPPEEEKNEISNLTPKEKEPQFSASKDEPEYLLYEISKAYELHLRSITFNQILQTVPKPRHLFLNPAQITDHFTENIPFMHLPKEYVELALMALMCDNRLKSQEEIIAELQAQGGIFQIKQEAINYISECNLVYIPAELFKTESTTENSPKLYYSLFDHWIIPRTNPYYSHFFEIMLNHFQLNELDSFLNYQLANHYQNNISDFGRLLVMVLNSGKHRIGRAKAEIVFSWIKHQEQIKNIELQQKKELKEGITPKTTGTFFTQTESSRKRQVLMIYFLFKSLGVQRAGVSVANMARFVHSLLGQPIEDINNSQLYKLLKQAPKLNEEKFLREDLYFVKKQFENIELFAIVEMIQKEINELDNKR